MNDLPSDADMINWLYAQNGHIRPATRDCPEDGWVVMLPTRDLDDRRILVPAANGLTPREALAKAMRLYP